MRQDTIQFAIQEDGTIKISTDQVSMPNHVNAEQLLKGVANLTDRNIKRQTNGKHVHTHTHGNVSHSH